MKQHIVKNKVNGKINHVGRRILEKNNTDSDTSVKDIDANDSSSVQTKPKVNSTSTQTESARVVKISSPASVIDVQHVVSPPVVEVTNESNRDRITECSSFLKQPKVLYASDTVGSMVNLRLVEKYSKTRVRTVKYSGSAELAHAVNVGLDFPGREPYEILAIAAPSEDISNLKVKDYERADIESQVTESCLKLVNVAKETLKKHKNLKKVVILEHPPRFDDASKSEMVDFANGTLLKLIVDCKTDHIKLGRQKLQCYGIGKTYEARYRNPLTKLIDGVHFFGPLESKALTESLIDIIVTLLKKSESGLNLSETDPFMLSNIQISNRYEILSQGNE